MKIILLQFNQSGAFVALFCVIFVLFLCLFGLIYQNEKYKIENNFFKNQYSPYQTPTSAWLENRNDFNNKQNSGLKNILLFIGLGVIFYLMFLK